MSDGFAAELDEMSEVARDEATPLAGREGELRWIGSTAQSDVVGAHSVEAAPAEGLSDRRRQVLVQIEGHARRMRPGYLASSASNASTFSAIASSISRGYWR